ncbi:HAD family hydrolase [Rhodobium gokarnense]|uniref:Sucrose-6F-phosphate phosphohydrolase n=1 Tax=Rhodobium gokarnense TaxID=364296 RepID=A0ABT3HCE8_9HYPH|nr:HAD family hydrolase [Rhodobium gokarnense]MCW2308073.1 sucrose-6F-phosphate phosphohydrolase [Rhodobium gokarnense]
MSDAKILATDLDRTLLPNGSWEPDENAIPLFNELTEKHGVLVVYVTGRNLDLTEKAIAEFGVRYPDFLCGDVGTSIRKREGGAWVDDPGWDAHVRRTSPRWDAAAVRDAVSGIAGIREQEAEHCGPFKQSYYADHDDRERILAEVEERVKGKFDEVIVYSFDSGNGNGLIDFLPQSATKQTALEYVAEAHGAPKDEVVFCGDSGNDIFPLTAGFSGVLVRNADAQLVEQVKAAMAENPDLKAYFAKGGVMGLSGYYTSGVIEGAVHYGLFEG